MIDERTMLTARFLWVHLATYLSSGRLATAERLRKEYDVAKLIPGMEMPEHSLARMIKYAEFVANEYLTVYSTPVKLELAVRGVAASIGVGVPSASEQELGELIYSDLRAAVIKNQIHVDFRAPSKEGRAL